jgi:hypothetical protein
VCDDGECVERSSSNASSANGSGSSTASGGGDDCTTGDPDIGCVEWDVGGPDGAPYTLLCGRSKALADALIACACDACPSECGDLYCATPPIAPSGSDQNCIQCSSGSQNPNPPCDEPWTACFDDVGRDGQ